MQLVLQVKQALRLGDLKTGDQLPTAKEVVGAVNRQPNTVLKAYRELESEGLVEARPGLGTFVTQSLAKPGMAERDACSPHSRGLGPPGRGGRSDRSDLEALVAAALDNEFGGEVDR